MQLTQFETPLAKEFGNKIGYKKESDLKINLYFQTSRKVKKKLFDIQYSQLKTFFSNK